jgi:hypothetical protein
MRSAKPSLDTLGLRHCLRVHCEAPLSPSEVTGVLQLQLSILWRQFYPAFKAAGMAIYASKSLPAVVCAPSRTLLFPDAE